jgi:hypothetical protein
VPRAKEAEGTAFANFGSEEAYKFRYESRRIKEVRNIMHSTMNAVIPLAALTIGVLSVAPTAQAQLAVQQPTTSVVGRLTQVMGIGGETTGWAVQTARGQFEIDVPSWLQREAARYADRQVRVHGVWSTRRGPERGTRWVLRAVSIQPVAQSRPDSRWPDSRWRQPITSPPPVYSPPIYSPPVYSPPYYRPYPPGYHSPYRSYPYAR